MATAQLHLDLRVVRLQVSTQDGPEEEGLRWTVQAFYASKLDPAVVILIGHLLVSEVGQWGQALVQVTLRKANKLPDEKSAHQFIRRYGAGFMEQAYDEARRAVTASGALLDLNLGLPVKAPDTELQIVPEPELELASEEDDPQPES